MKKERKSIALCAVLWLAAGIVGIMGAVRIWLAAAGPAIQFTTPGASYAVGVETGGPAAIFPWLPLFLLLLAAAILTTVRLVRNNGNDRENHPSDGASA